MEIVEGNNTTPIPEGTTDAGNGDTYWNYGESGDFAYDYTYWYDTNATDYNSYAENWFNTYTYYSPAFTWVTYEYDPSMNTDQQGDGFQDDSLYSEFGAYQYEEPSNSNTSSSGSICFGTQCWDIHINPGSDGQLVEGVLLCCLGIIVFLTIMNNARNRTLKYKPILIGCGVATIVATISRAVKNLIDFCANERSADGSSTEPYPFPACVFSQTFAFFDSVCYHSFLYMTSVFGLQFASQFVSETFAKQVTSSLFTAVFILATMVLAVLTNIKTIVDWISILTKFGASVTIKHTTETKLTSCLMPNDLSKDMFFSTLPLALPAISFICIALMALTCRREIPGKNDKTLETGGNHDTKIFKVINAVFFLLMATWTLTPFLYHVIMELTNPYVGINLHRFIDPLAYLTVTLYFWSVKFVQMNPISLIPFLQINQRKHLNRSAMRERNGGIPSHTLCQVRIFTYC